MMTRTAENTRMGKSFAAGCCGVLLLFVLIAGAPTVRGQGQEIDVESMIRRQHITCSEIAFGATGLIPTHHMEGNTDTLQSILRYWEYHCGITEPMMRFTILWQIQSKTFNEDWLPDRLILYLDDYQEAIENPEHGHYFFDFDAWEYHALDPEFNTFTAQMADGLMEFGDLDSLERFFALFYSHDFEAAWLILAGDSLPGTRLDTLYQDQAEQSLSRQRLHLGFYFGMWRPGGKLDLFGLSPQIGLMLEGNNERFLYGIHMKMAFGAPRQRYEVVVDGQSYQTRNMLQFHIGLLAGIDMLKSESNSLFLAPGLGYDGIDPFSQSDRDAGIGKTLHSYNLNAALIYQRRLETRNVVTILLRYNVVNYRNTGGTDLSGNVITFGLGYGMGQW